MKTIFITSFHPLVSRNIIATPILAKLALGGAKVVVIIPDYKRAYFDKTFGEARVIFEGVDIGPKVRTKRVGIFKRLAEAMPQTKRAALGRKRTLSGEKKSSRYYLLFYLPAAILGRFRFFVELVRWLDFHLSPRGRFYNLLAQYRPEAVFAADVQNEHDVALMQDARRYGIRIIGMVRSWDNLTTRMIRFIPDGLLVHNEIIKNEAIRVQGITPSKISVVGIPHYDAYLKGPTQSRDAFLRSLGADPQKKTILYIPICDYRMRENSVDRFLLEILSGIGANVIVRFPPAETVNIAGFTKPPHMIFDQPGFKFSEHIVGDRELTREDGDRFLNEVAFSDIVVCGPSTVVIDAALFDKPIILADLYPGELPEEDKIYEYRAEHFTNILVTGGVERARSREEFLALLAEYFADPSRDRAGRRRIREEQCWALDGRSCQRLAETLLSKL